MPGALDSCVNNVYEDGNIPASSGETPTRVLLKDPLEVEITEAASAADDLDAFVGMFVVEAASASDTVDFTGILVVTINEAAAAVDVSEATFAGGIFADVVEAATADSVQDAALVVNLATYDGTTVNVTMSNGNLTALHHNTTTNSGVISTAFESTGKYYFEVTLQTSTTNQNFLGIMLSTWSGVFSATQMTTNSTSVNLGGTSNIYSNGANTSKNLGAQAVGDVYSAAIDLTAHLGWFRKNGGNWNADAGADPATGTGGVTIASGSFAPIVRFATGGASTDQMTGNFGQSSFVYTAPSGFGNWPA